MTELKQYIKQFFDVQEKELDIISAHFSPKTIRKGDYYLKLGSYSNQFAFVQSGLLREFLYVNDKEVTKWIYTQGYFALDLASFTFNTPARWNIQALSDCEVFVINRTDYNNLIHEIPNWPVLEKHFIAKCFSVLEERVVQHLSHTTEERYVQFFNFNKKLFNEVPLQYLASMLGMTPETFSRIRKKRADLLS